MKLLRALRLLGLYLRYRFAPLDRSPAALAKWQRRRLGRQLAWIAGHAPFYRELWQTAAPGAWQKADLAALPIIDKSVMMRHFDRLNTAQLRLADVLRHLEDQEQTRDFQPLPGGLYAGLSSGTSGHRGVFVASARESSHYLAVVLARAMPRPLWQKQRIGFFLRHDNGFYQDGGSVSRRFALRYFDMYQPLSSHITALAAFNPTLLVGPASVLRLLAEAQSRGELRLSVDKIVSVAEVLDPVDEQRIAAAFQLKVIHQYYQCTEGFLGMTCSEGTMHLNEDVVHIGKEYLDTSRSRFYPLVTDLVRRVQPLVRYRLNDILTERATPCPCGSAFTAVAMIEGRADDVFYYVRSGGGEPVLIFPDFIRRALILSTPAVIGYKALQHSLNELEISLELRPEAVPYEVEAEVRRRLAQLASDQGAVAPEVVFTPYQLATSHGAKMRRVERAFQL